MKEKIYNKEIATAISNFLTDDNWYFGFNEEKGIFRFDLSLKGKLKKISYVIDVRESEYLVYAIFPINAETDDEKMMTAIAEFICRANYGLKNGNFEFDFRDGEIRFKIHIPCDGILPSAEIIKDSVYCPGSMFRTYGSGILSIIFGDANAKEAVKQCEDSEEHRIRRQQMIEEECDTDTDTMLTRLADRLSLENTDNKPEDEQEGTEDSEVKTELFNKKGGAA